MNQSRLAACLLATTFLGGAAGCSADSATTSESTAEDLQHACRAGDVGAIASPAGLNLHASPSVGAATLVTVPANRSVTVLATQSAGGRQWLQVDYVDPTGKKWEGWVAAQALPGESFQGAYVTCGGSSGGTSGGAPSSGGTFEVVLVQTDAEPAQVSDFLSLANPGNFGASVHVNVLKFDGAIARDPASLALGNDPNGGQAQLDANLEKLATYFDSAAPGQYQNIALALSGHSTGDWFWGSGVSVSQAALSALLGRHPGFRDRVTFFYALGCNGGRQYYVENVWRKAFPKAWVLGGFYDVGPTGAAGGDAYFADGLAIVRRLGQAGVAQAVATTAAALVNPSGFGGFRAADNMNSAVEIALPGAPAVYRTRSPLPAGMSSQNYFDQAFGAEQTPGSLAYEFDAYLSNTLADHADLPAADPHDTVNNPLRRRYNAIQGYVNALHQEGHPTDAMWIWDAMNKSLMLCLFRDIQAAWAHDHLQLAAALGVSEGALATMKRADLRALAAAHASSAPDAAQALLGVVELSAPNLINYVGAADR